MVDRVKAAVDARTDAGFVIMARTDAAAVEGIDAAIDRACAYVEAGADMIFPEAMKTLDDYRRFKAAVKVPILANLTEFGSTPFFTIDELREANVDIALYCCGAYRAMNKAALHFYETVRREGTQKNIIDTLQTRDELYDFLGYHAYEDKLDALFAQDQARGMTMSETHQAAPKAKKSVALSGTPAGNTALCTVGRSGNDLHYRGYDIQDLATKSLVRGSRAPAGARHAADRVAAAAYKTKLKRLRGLPAIVAEALELVPANAHPMDVLRTGCSVLGTVLPERDTHPASEARDIADRLMASFGSMLLYWWHFTRNGDASTARPTTTRSPRTSCTCCTASRRATLHARRAGQVAGAVRRARVQRLDLHRARHRRHRQRHAFVHHRRDRRAARPQARRRQRSGDGDHLPLRDAGRGRGRHPRAHGAQGDRDRLRPPGLHHRRPAQPDHQGDLAQAVRRRRQPGSCSTCPSASRR